MKVPLLEYLDKLEAQLGPGRYGGCGECGRSDSATLALIEKLRDAVDIVREAVDIALHHPPADVVNRFQDSVISWAIQDSVISWASIEVPE